jgi:hypothetical protein
MHTAVVFQKEFLEEKQVIRSSLISQWICTCLQMPTKQKFSFNKDVAHTSSRRFFHRSVGSAFATADHLHTRAYREPSILSPGEFHVSISILPQRYHAKLCAVMADAWRTNTRTNGLLARII